MIPTGKHNAKEKKKKCDCKLEECGTNTGANDDEEDGHRL